MLFNSYIYIFLFLPLVLLGYYYLCLNNNKPQGLLWLLGASLFFYAWWNPKYLLVLLASILLNYCLAKIIFRVKKKTKKNILILGISLDLLILGYFKYANFFIDNMNFALGMNYSFPEIILPLAISFHTFQQIAYLIDAYKGNCQEDPITHFFLFVSFFPQLIAGPIVYHHEIFSQFHKKLSKHAIFKYLSVGISIFVIGLFKKVVLADGVAIYATPVFEAAANGVTLSFFEAWVGALAYTLQLYFDFCGYADMAIGSAYMFGIKLPQNFNSPYLATSIIDFWRRWHMSLSRFLRNYLYIPLGGSRGGVIYKYRNLMITMLLGGLWHGAGWTYLMWGLLHGFYLCINHAWRAFCERINLPLLRGRVFTFLVYRPLTLLSVVVGWVYFRASTLESANVILNSMCGLSGISLPKRLAQKLAPLNISCFEFKCMFTNGIADFDKAFIWIMGLFTIAFLMPNTNRLFTIYRPSLPVFNDMSLNNGIILKKSTWIPNILMASISALLLWICIIVMNANSEFLYFQF